LVLIQLSDLKVKVMGVISNLDQGDYAVIQYFSKHQKEKYSKLGGIVLANNNNDVELIPLNRNETPERILRIYDNNPRKVVIRKRTISSHGLKEHIPDYINNIRKQLEGKK
jgi:hypothetical protein